MRRAFRVVLLGLAAVFTGGALTAAVVTAESAETRARVRNKRGGIVADTSLTFTIVTGSRLAPDWKEEQVVRLHEHFYLGDQPYTAAVEEFMESFIIDEGKAFNDSDSLANPAAFVKVYADTGAVDSTWAFLNFPPHFSPKSFFTFQIKALGGYAGPAAGEEGK